jgi:hypothetical protein
MVLVCCECTCILWRNSVAVRNGGHHGGAVFESFERENGRVIVFPSSVVGSDNASAVSEKWRDQKMSQKFAPEVGTSPKHQPWSRTLKGLFHPASVLFFSTPKFQRRPWSIKDLTEPFPSRPVSCPFKKAPSSVKDL